MQLPIYSASDFWSRINWSIEGGQYIRDFKKFESKVVKLEYLNIIDPPENTACYIEFM